MKKLMRRLSWETRRWNVTINILKLYLHDNDSSWGFRLFEVVHNFHSYTLLGIDFRFPNGAEVKYFVVDNFDIFFLNRPLNKWANRYSDNKMWGRVYTDESPNIKLIDFRNKVDELKYNIIKTIFK